METKIIYKLFESHGIQDILPKIQEYIDKNREYYILMSEDYYGQRQYLGIYKYHSEVCLIILRKIIDQFYESEINWSKIEKWLDKRKYNDIIYYYFKKNDNSKIEYKIIKSKIIDPIDKNYSFNIGDKTYNITNEKFDTELFYDTNY
jgi:hypothetical protein